MKDTRDRRESPQVGSDPDIVIRIAPDGRVYFHDITRPMLGIVDSIARRPDERGARRAQEVEATVGGTRLV